MRKEEKIPKEDFYRTVDQRILGDEEFIERVRERFKNGVTVARRKHGVSLGQIATGIEEILGIRLGELRERGKDRGLMEGRRLFTLVGREYGYKGKEIAEFLRKDPAAVTGYLRGGQDLRAKIERLVLHLEGR